MARFKRLKPRDDSGGLRTWKNEKGEVCIGTECFHVKAEGADVVINYDSSDPNCSKDVKKAVDGMFALIAKGGAARFRHRRE